MTTVTFTEYVLRLAKRGAVVTILLSAWHLLKTAADWLSGRGSQVQIETTGLRHQPRHR